MVGSGVYSDKARFLATNPLWSALALDTGAGVAVLGLDGVVHALNPVGERWLGRRGRSAIGRALVDLSPAAERSLVSSWLDGAMAGVEEAAEADAVLRDGVASRDGRVSRDGRWASGVSQFDHVRGGVRWMGRARGVELDGLGGAVLLVAAVARRPVSMRHAMSLVDRVGDRAAALGDLAELTDRELEVALLITAGMGDAQAALAIHRSPRTVHAHRRTLGRKLRVSTRGQVAQVFAERGFVVEPPEGLTPAE